MSELTLPKQRAWEDVTDDLIRGVAGGFLFGVPLLYTMEVWWIGSFSRPPQLLLALAITFIAVALLNRTSGFRKAGDTKLRDVLFDTVEAMAVGVICVTITLLLLRLITLETPLSAVLGKVIFEAIPFALGVAVANQFLSGERDEKPADQPAQAESTELNATIADIGATLIGATFIASTIAPTDEIPLLAASSTPPWQLCIVAASLLLSYAIVFEAGFANQARRRKAEGLFQQPLSETVVTYLISLAVAAAMLWFFEQLDSEDPWTMWLGYSLLLGLPATIGGAAGRLAL